jgi:hypothetical protein
MSVTFCAEPNELSFIAFDYHLECSALHRQDPRTFRTYAEAVAALRDHSDYCRDEFCGPDTPYPYPVARTAADDEPSLNISNVNARALLRTLGLLPEIGAEAVLTDIPLGPAGPHAGHDELAGVCDSADLLARIDLALALAPADPGVPGHAVTDRFINCGRHPGYPRQVPTTLREITVCARDSRRAVSWS